MKLTTVVFELIFFLIPEELNSRLPRMVKYTCLSLSLFVYTQIELIDRVDDIYRNTSWDNAGFKGYGILIEQVFNQGMFVIMFK